MEDLLFVAATVAFFALASAYVRFCDRIIGPDPVEVTSMRDEKALAEATR